MSVLNLHIVFDNLFLYKLYNLLFPKISIIILYIIINYILYSFVSLEKKNIFIIQIIGNK